MPDRTDWSIAQRDKTGKLVASKGGLKKVLGTKQNKGREKEPPEPILSGTSGEGVPRCLAG